jgi:hypothetical protein
MSARARCKYGGVSVLVATDSAKYNSAASWAEALGDSVSIRPVSLRQTLVFARVHGLSAKNRRVYADRCIPHAEERLGQTLLESAGLQAGP